MAKFPYLLAFLASLPLAGCYADQQRSLASCEADALARFPKPVPGQPFKTVQACMTQAGYTFIGWDEGIVCDMGAVVTARPSATGTDAVCFEPSGWLARKLYRIEVPEKSQRSGG